MSTRTGTRRARVLLALSTGRGQHRVDLAVRLALPRMAVQAILDLLVEQGLAVHDGRAFRLATGAHVARARAEARELLVAIMMRMVTLAAERGRVAATPTAPPPHPGTSTRPEHAMPGSLQASRSDGAA